MAEANTNPYFNPHMSAPYALLVELLPRLGEPGLKTDVEPELLDAVSKNCEASLLCIHALIEAIGTCQAAAADTGLSDDTVANLGYGVSYLGGLADGLERVKDDVGFHLKQQEVKS